MNSELQLPDLGVFGHASSLVIIHSLLIVINRNPKPHGYLNKRIEYKALQRVNCKYTAEVNKVLGFHGCLWRYILMKTLSNHL